MPSKRFSFRPCFQMLETRRCMAAAVGELVAEPTDGTDEIAIIAKPAEFKEHDAFTTTFDVGAINDAPLMDAVSATPTEPATPAANVTVTGTTISGNTANQEGGGIWNITPEEEYQEAGLLLPDDDFAREVLLIVNNGDGSDFTPDGRRLVVTIKDGGILNVRDADASAQEGGGLWNSSTESLRVATDFDGDGDVDIFQVTQSGGESTGGIFTITVTLVDDDTGQAVDSGSVIVNGGDGSDFAPYGRQLVVSIKGGPDADATDAFFSEVGSEDSGATATWTIDGLTPGREY